MGNQATTPPGYVYKKIWVGLSFGLLVTSVLLFLSPRPPPTIHIVYTQDRSKYDGKWKSFKEPYHVYAYSAFYDDRKSLGTFPVVRVVAVADILDYEELYCILYYKDHDQEFITEADSTAIGMGVGVRNHFLREYIITCPLIDEFVPYLVGLVPWRTGNVTFTLPVFAPPRHPIKQDFVVCVSVSYWKPDPYRIVEWMELLRTFGASKVTIYNNSLSKEASDIFKHYDRTGFVDFRQSHNFVPDSTEYNIHLHMSPVINDCMYRNMHSFKKVVVTDLDEIITPRQHTTYKDMLRAIDETQPNYHPARNYVFSNVYFFTDFPNKRTDRNVAVRSNLFTMKYLERLPPSPPGYSIKSIIDPQACVNMHNHYCWGLTQLHLRVGEHVDVHPEFGLNHHYKKCHLDLYEKKGLCAKMAKHTILDENMLRFEKVLTNRVNARLDEIGLKHL